MLVSGLSARGFAVRPRHPNNLAGPVRSSSQG